MDTPAANRDELAIFAETNYHEQTSTPGQPAERKRSRQQEVISLPNPRALRPVPSRGNLPLLGEYDQSLPRRKRGIAGSNKQCSGSKPPSLSLSDYQRSCADSDEGYSRSNKRSLGPSDISSGWISSQADHTTGSRPPTIDTRKFQRRLRGKDIPAKRNINQERDDGGRTSQAREGPSNPTKNQVVKAMPPHLTARFGNPTVSPESLGRTLGQIDEEVYPCGGAAMDSDTTTSYIHGRLRGSPSYWEQHPARLLTRSRSEERYFIIETGSPVAEQEYSAHSDIEGGVEPQHASTFRRMMNHLSRARNAISQTTSFGTLSATTRKKMQYLVILATFAGASSCVSVMSVAGTNSLVITGAITAILALGKILCDVLADHPGDGVGVP
ncbi:hypothetical protein MMC30_003836 [Trapelia coarctata]|nr:hypothetical protein [Trapelia coarctata]